MRPKIETCKKCGWQGEFIRHKSEHCARYLQIKEMYLTGMSSRAVARALGTSSAAVLYALKAARVKTRSPGGANNPLGINGRAPQTPAPAPGS